MFAILRDAVFACISAFAIIYALSFMFKGFIQTPDGFIERKKDE